MHTTLVVRVIDGQEVPYEEARSTIGEGVPPRVGPTEAREGGPGLRQHEPAGRSSPRDRVGVERDPPSAAAKVAADTTSRELRRKIAWAVGSVWRVKYQRYDSWPAAYARLAAERLIDIHGEPR